MKSAGEMIKIIEEKVMENSSDDVKRLVEKCYNDGLVFETKVVGTTYQENAQKALERLVTLDKSLYPAVMEREDWNEYDSNAVAVKVKGKGDRYVKMGYVNKNLAKIFRYMEQHGIEIETEGYLVSGGGDFRYGMVLLYRLRPEE